MALGLTKTYTPSSGDVANATTYNTDISSLFNAFTGLEAQTSTLGGLTILPTSNSATKFQIKNAAGTSLFSLDTTGATIKLNEDFGIAATKKLYLDGGGNTYLVEGVADQLSVLVGGSTYIEMKSNSIVFPKDLGSNQAGVTNIGDAVLYFGDVSYKTLTDRGCLGCFDDGVELQDGTKVSDTEALLSIKKHPTKKTIYGVDMLDYKTFPKVSYKKAETKEKGILPRDANDEPIGGTDGIEMTSMFSIMIGSIKELTNRVTALEGK